MDTLIFKHKLNTNVFSFIIFLTLLTSIEVMSKEDGLHNKVKLATGKGYAPFVDDSLPQGGWSTRVVKETFSKLKLDIEVDVLPWRRVLKWTDEGKYLAAFPFVHTKERAKHFLFSAPINIVPIHMYVASNSGFSQPEQLRKKRLCFPLSYSLDPAEQSIVDEYQMIINRVKGAHGCIKHVQKGWSDAGFTNGYIDLNALVSDDLDNTVLIFEQPLAFASLHLVIGKNLSGASQWMKEFDHALLVLKKNGEKAVIDQQYLELVNIDKSSSRIH